MFKDYNRYVSNQYRYRSLNLYLIYNIKHIQQTYEKNLRFVIVGIYLR